MINIHVHILCGYSEICNQQRINVADPKPWTTPNDAEHKWMRNYPAPIAGSSWGLPFGNPTWQWNMYHTSMIFLIKPPFSSGIFHCHVWLLEVLHWSSFSGGLRLILYIDRRSWMKLVRQVPRHLSYLSVSFREVFSNWSCNFSDF